MIRPTGPWGRLVFDPPQPYVSVTSIEIVSEIIDVLNRPALTSRFLQIADRSRIVELLALFGSAEIVGPLRIEPVCRDPGDDKFFACAVAGNAQYIVSEDLDVLSITEHKGVRTVSASQFMQILDRSA
jgi:putative PIN family toxin of toxin-antitoxin system